jgi:hypothetical protein
MSITVYTLPSQEAYEKRLNEARAAFEEALATHKQAEVKTYGPGGSIRPGAWPQFERATALLDAARQRVQDGERGRWRVRELPDGEFEIDEGVR